MASQFLPSIDTCSFEWKLVPTHPPQNNICLISIAPGPSSFSSAQPLLGKQALASRKERGKMDIAIEAINYQVANSTDACERKSIFGHGSSQTPQFRQQKNMFILTPKQLSICSAGFYRCQSLTLRTASVPTLSQNHQQRHQTLDTTRYSNKSFIFPAVLCFSDRIAHFCFCLP